MLKVAVTLYTLLSSSIRASMYHVSTDSSAHYTCPDDVSSCHIYCDVADTNNANIFDCNNSLHCYFYCDAKQCAQDAVIVALNSNILHIMQESSGQECLRDAKIFTPNTGSAYFTSHSKAGFKGMKVYAGSNAKDIIIDTTTAIADAHNGSEYRGMDVYASNAEYVRINIAANLEWSLATIECPVGSVYSGPDPASCMINAINGTMNDIAIIAPEGTPENVIIEGCNSCHNVQILCNRTELNGSVYPFNETNHCWLTGHTTVNPTFNQTTDTDILIQSIEPTTSIDPTDDHISTHTEWIQSRYIIAAGCGIIIVVICICMCCWEMKNKEYDYPSPARMSVIPENEEEQIQREHCYDVQYVTVTAPAKEHTKTSTFGSFFGRFTPSFGSSLRRDENVIAKHVQENSFDSTQL